MLAVVEVHFIQAHALVLVLFRVVLEVVVTVSQRLSVV
jgi:hypothetical protein